MPVFFIALLYKYVIIILQEVFKMKTTTFTMTKEMYNYISEESWKLRMNKSQFIRMLIENYKKEQEDK